MIHSSARRAALQALRTWRTQNQLADAVLSSVLTASVLGASDRGFAQELFYGVLRNLTLLDFWINQLRSSRLNADLRDIVRLGLYQLFLLGVSEHAAVFESVQIAPVRNRGLINAILRSATRQRAALEKLARQEPLSVRLSHPEFLVERWEKAFGQTETAELCAWNNEPPRIYARINTLMISREEFLQTYGDANALPGRPGFVEFATTFPYAALQKGECYIQDPSTALACELLDPQKGDIILDACAAPGGKTSLIAALMENDGTILACDREAGRLSVLQENLERLGVTIGRVMRHDWRSGAVPPALAAIAPVDRLLIDAPCSNTGVMRRRVDVRWRLRPEEFARMQTQQVSIVRSAMELLQPGGILVYSTCSLEGEENSGVIERVTAELPLRLEQERVYLPFRDGCDGAYVARLIKAS